MIRKALSRCSRVALVAVLCAVMLSATASVAGVRARHEPGIPDIPGYLTLRCDFHMHTVFSDGRVWPTVRVEEAWREGLDAFSITDHLEYRPFEEDIPADHNRSHDIAAPGARELGLLLIKGSEITKAVPPGHFNAIFLTDSNPLDREDYLDAIGEAIKQDAFVFWNHPPFKQKDNQSIWHPEHTAVYEKGWLHGIEVINGRDYYPKAHLWCLEKGLTMLATSDIHNPVNLDYDPEHGDLRPVTLVFATEKSPQGIREALFARRTAVCTGREIYGEAKYLGPIFDESVELLSSRGRIRGTGSCVLQVRNRSDVPFTLALEKQPAELEAPERLTLHADRVVVLRLRGKDPELSGARQVDLHYRVENLQPRPGEGLPVSFSVTVDFEPAEKEK